MSTIDWDQLRVFLAIVRNGQMLAASRGLGLNHATVARRLDALEASLGLPLFERRPGGTVPTEAGLRLLPVAERVEAEVSGIVDELRGEEHAVSGTVRIGVPDGLGNYFLASELGALLRLHPRLVIELVPLPRAFSLSRREADLAIGLDFPTEGRLTVTRLSDYTLSVYASRDYLASHGVPESPDVLSGHVVVTGVKEFAYASALDYSRALDDRTSRVFRCASVMGQLEAVKAGTGVGILHDFAAQRVPELIRILPQIGFRRSYFLLGHPDSAGLRRIAACREFIARRFREERRRFLPLDAAPPAEHTGPNAEPSGPARNEGSPLATQAQPAKSAGPSRARLRCGGGRPR